MMIVNYKVRLMDTGLSFCKLVVGLVEVDIRLLMFVMLPNGSSSVA